jgi:chromate reductase
MDKRKILAISGSTRNNSSNLILIKTIAVLANEKFEIIIYNNISDLPHFNPDLDTENPPAAVVHFRKLISEVDGVIICTPEYVFSLPGSLKNALEWCVSTTLFSQKPTGLITASASGEKGQEELKLVMKTIEAKFGEENTLLIKGIKGKINSDEKITDEETIIKIKNFIAAFDNLLNK